MVRAPFVLIASLSLFACRGAPTPTGARVIAPEPLTRPTLQTLAREACPRLLARTFPLESEGATTGELWVRECAAEVDGDALDVRVAVLGWQWVGQGSWGFTVREFAYFRASVRARLHAVVEVEGEAPKLRLWSEDEPRVAVREIGRVSARASTSSAAVLGFVTRVVGQGPNALATSALRSHVTDAIRTNAQNGVLVALRDAQIPGAQGAPGAALLDESQRLEPGGALISGSFAPGVPLDLRFRVNRGGAALARAVCDEEAAGFVDSVIAGEPTVIAGAPRDVVELRGEGERRIPAQPCWWVLVTGPQTDGGVSLHVALSPVLRSERIAARRWVRPTIRAMHLDASRDDRLLGLRLAYRGVLLPLGRPLTSGRADALALVADPIELEDGEALDVAIVALSPRRRRWWSGVVHDETRIGDAVIAPKPGALRDERRVPIEVAGHRIGWMDVALEAIEVP